MRIESEIEVLTVGSLRALLAQAERAGAGNDAAVSFSRRRTEGGYVARVEFEPIARPSAGGNRFPHPSDGAFKTAGEIERAASLAMSDG